MLMFTPSNKTLAALAELKPYFICAHYLCCTMNNRQKWHNIAYSSWAVELVVLARQYCAKLTGTLTEEGEETAAGGEVAIQDWLYPFLGLLFYKMSRCPNLQQSIEFDELGGSLSEFDYQQVRTGVEELLGVDDVIAFELSEEEARIYQGAPHLSEIAADLYQELYELLIHYNDGEEERMVMALARCQYYFLMEWGTKLLLGLRWLQILHAESFLVEDEEDA